MIALGRRVPIAAASAADVLSRRSYLFVHVALIACLCLQRFGLSSGTMLLFVGPPVFACLLAWLLKHGQAKVSRHALILYCVMALWFLASTVTAIAFPDPRTENSIGSLASILSLYAFMVIEPSARFDRSRTLAIFLFYVRLLSVLGIVQYFVQFAGVRVFSFTDTLPFLKPILVEHRYAFRPLLKYGSETMRSNGFLLVEPSVFSQVLVLGVVAELFANGQRKYLALYGVAYAVTHSGTGFLSLIVAVAIFGFTSPRNMVRTLGLIAAVAILALGMAMFMPSSFESFVGRSQELQNPNSSGYARYVAQFHQIGIALQEIRCLIGYGPGATERSIHYFPGSGNPALKLFIDYGVIGVALFAAFLGTRLLRARPLLLPILCLTMFQLGGGSLLFSPTVILLTVLCIWSGPKRRTVGPQYSPYDAPPTSARTSPSLREAYR